MMDYKSLRHEQARQIIDGEQVFSAFLLAQAELHDRSAGSMLWKTINDGTYLYRKVKDSNHSLGVMSDETERMFRAFHDGRDRLRARLASLKTRLDEMAPVNKALGIGRIPAISARVLRRIGSAGLMGTAIDVVGTSALFAYERLCGVQIKSGLLATGDVDPLFDARSSLKLITSELRSEGLLGLLRKVDSTFAPMGRRSFRAANDEGFMVDLIQPMPRNRFATSGRTTIGASGDPEAVEIEGLAWLVNSPKLETIVFDERGYPLRISVPDPRAFTMHKAWLSSRDDREPLKRKRDAGQARLVAEIVTQHLPHLAFEGPDLSAMPLAMRQAVKDILPVQKIIEGHDGEIEPD